MNPTRRVLLLAVGAGVLGAAAGLWFDGPGPPLRQQSDPRAQAGGQPSEGPAAVPVAAPGQRVPAFTLPALDGRDVEVPTAYAGRPVLLNVWASWCGPCIREMPELERYARAQGPHGTQVVGIALDDAASVRAFLQRVAVGYPVLLDAPGPRDAGVRLGNVRNVLPYSVLLGADGRVRRQKTGPFGAGEIEEWAR